MRSAQEDRMIWVIACVLGAAILWWAWENHRRRRHPVTPGFQADITLPFQAPFELYHNALSLCSMKTRVCLAELGISYRSHHIDLVETGGYENIRPKLLDVNPAGTVPVLVHEGHPVYESHEQIRYAAAYSAAHAPPGSPSLVPDDPALKASMEHWIDLSSLTHDPINHGDESIGNAVPGLTVPLFATTIETIPAWKIVEGLLFHFDKQRPVVFLTLKLFGIERIGRLGPAVKILARSLRQTGVHLDTLEAQLVASGGPWILGDPFTLADVSWLVIFERLRQADAMSALVGNAERPECAAYWERLRQRPSYRLAILDHSHPVIEHGTRRLQEVKAADPALRALLEGDATPA
jgi:glutathione S-transferase